MPAYGVTIRDTATPLARALERQGTRAAPVVGRAAAETTREHFRQKNLTADTHRSANIIGAKPSGLFNDFRNATSFEASGSDPAVVVRHPAIRQRIEGGRIEPGPGKEFLTEPAQAIAYGKRAREFPNLVFAWASHLQTGRTGFALVAPSAISKEVGRARRDGTKRTKEIAPSGVYFWLIRSATQRGDAGAIPSADQMQEGIASRLDGYFGDAAERTESDNG